MIKAGILIIIQHPSKLSAIFATQHAKLARGIANILALTAQKDRSLYLAHQIIQLDSALIHSHPITDYIICQVVLGF